MPTRRRFLATASTLAAGAALLPHTLYGISRPASDRVRVGLIGAKNMGWSNVKAQLSGDRNTELAWLCDVDDAVIGDRLNAYAGLRQNKPQTCKDYRQLLAAKEVDAVVIGTPDHWHARQFVDALEAGKPTYVEKPIANSIAECRAMVAAQERTGQVVQVGQWQRSGEHYARAYDWVRSGQLGRISLVKVWRYKGESKPLPHQPDGPVPAGVDYGMWLGPAEARPFNPNRFHYNFRWFWDYAGGLMTDWGVHEIDIAAWAMNAGTPRSVMTMGGKLIFPDDAAETPDTLQALFEYDDFTMLWEHSLGLGNGPYGLGEGIAFLGTAATLVLNRQGFHLLPESGFDVEAAAKAAGLPQRMERPSEADYVQLHNQNFLDCVRANTPEKCATTIQSGALAAVNAQLGAIAYKTGDRLHWEGDWRTGGFRQNDRAKALLTPTYHNGWVLPR